MIGERLKRARAAAGLSMQALGDQVGVSANMIKKYEHNQSMPGSAVLIRLADTLGVRSEYFFRPATAELKGVDYRKRSKAPAGLLKRVEADVLDQAERWLELANLWPDFPVPAFTLPQNLPPRIESLEAVEALAETLRQEWALGMNPVPDLIDEAEARGVLVILTEVDPKAAFDGLQASVNGVPVIVLSGHWPGDRQRFTLAHELGHLMLDGRLATNLDEEKACNRFASAFLLPAAALRNQLGTTRHAIEPQELYMLKHEYGISMQACLYRAGTLGIISERVYRKQFMLFAKHGWRKHEPGEPYPREETLLFRQLVYRALGEDIISESKAAELLGMPLMAFHQQRTLSLQNAVAHQ